MRASDNNTPTHNVIHLVECLKKIDDNETKISLYAEKMIDENTGETIYY